MIVYKATNTKKIGTPKWGRQPLNFFTHYKTEINFLDENEQPSGKSVIMFRFHSSKAFANKPVKDHIKEHGGIHVRYFVYDGIDKTEAELIEWALNTDQVANDGKTTIHNAKEV